MKIVEPGAVKTSFRFVLANDESIREYQKLVQEFRETTGTLMEVGSDPMEVAQVIYRAATDGTNQLRYISGRDADEMIAKRRVADDLVFLEEMRKWKRAA